MDKRLIILGLTLLALFFMILMVAFFQGAKTKFKNSKEEIAGYTMGFIGICCAITAWLINNGIITL